MMARSFFDSIDSTQSRAVELAREGAVPGTLVVAARQSSGRGRSDHHWVSPPGGVYLSIVLRPPTAAPHLLSLGLAAGVRAHLRDQYGVSPSLKWPNDLLCLADGLPPRKIAGVLVDGVVDPSGQPRLVAGIGLNATTERALFPPDLRDRVAVLQELTPLPVELGALEEQCVGVTQSVVAQLDDPQGAGRVLAECRAALYGKGHHALVDGVPGGVIEGIDEDGALHLRSHRGLVALHSGDLTVMEAS